MTPQPKFWIGQKVRLKEKSILPPEVWRNLYEDYLCCGKHNVTYTIDEVHTNNSGDYIYHLRGVNYHQESILEAVYPLEQPFPRIPMNVPILLPRYGLTKVIYIILVDEPMCRLSGGKGKVPFFKIIEQITPIL